MRLPFEGFYCHFDPEPHEYDHYNPFPNSKTYLRYLRLRGVSKRNPWPLPEKVPSMQGEVNDDDRIVFAVTVSYKYETTGAKLKAYYGTTDLTEAAIIDTNNLKDDPQFVADDLNRAEQDYSVRVSAARFTGDE